MRRVLMLLALVAAPAFSQYMEPVDPMREVRYCGAPKRDANGEIVRSSAVLAAFQRLHPCPSTGQTTGACPGWRRDHQWPLACGGCDSISNLAWWPHIMKSGPGPLPKDRWERKLFCDHALLPMPEKALPLTVVSPPLER